MTAQAHASLPPGVARALNRRSPRICSRRSPFSSLALAATVSLDHPADHLVGLLGRGKRIVRVGVLRQEHATDALRGLDQQAVGILQSLGTDDLGHFPEALFLLQQRVRLLSQRAPVRRNLLVEMRGHVRLVEREALEPVDRREVPPVRQRRIEHEERAGVAQAGLRDRLGEIAARRRNGQHHGQRADLAVERLDHAGAREEFSHPRPEIGRVTLLAGHLLESRRDLAQRLGPPRQAVGKQQHAVAHVAVVLRDGDGRVDGRLARGHRHVGGVHHDDGPAHQWPLAPRVAQHGEIVEHLGHLVAAFATADVDDDVHLRELGDRLLEQRLAGTEPARKNGAAAPGQRKQEVDAALPGDEGLEPGELAPVGPGQAHRPIVIREDLAAVGH